MRPQHDSGRRDGQADRPLVSVVIPAYNCERYIARAVRSVLGQTYTNFECIVIDDGSTDGTAAVVEGFGERVRLIRQCNGGASAARNAGIAAAQGRYIAFLDSDDYWLSSKLECQVEIMREHPDLALVSCGFSWLRAGVDPDYLDPSAPVYDPSALELQEGLGDLLNAPYLGTPTVLVDALLATEAGGFDTSLPVGEDLDFYLKICAGRRFVRLRQTLVLCQLRHGSLTTRPGGYRYAIEVLERVRLRHSDADTRIFEMVDHCKQDIYRKWIESLIFRGEGAEARSVLRASRRDTLVSGAGRLYLKSLVAEPIRRFRALRRRFVGGGMRLRDAKGR